MKKISMFLATCALFLGLAACGGETTIPTTAAVTTQTTTVTTPVPTSPTTTFLTTSAQSVLDSAYDWLTMGDLSAVTSAERLILPTTRNDVAIAWTISDLDVIAANGMVTQPDHVDGNATVTLTATFSYPGATSRQKVFTATVIALPDPKDAEPIMAETFSGYDDGIIIVQLTSGVWAPVSGKTGNSLFEVVSSIPGTTIPNDAHALKINAFKELQIEGAIPHAYDVVVVEADLFQTANGSPIYIQTSASSPVVGIGLSGGSSGSARTYYRTDNGVMINYDLTLNTWHRVRLEVDLVLKTIEYFVYDQGGNLVPITPGKVGYDGFLAFQSLFIRSGSSTTTELNPNPSYVTNILVNRIEALPRPAVEPYKIGKITGIDPSVLVELGTDFIPDDPVVQNYYGSQSVWVKDSDYLLEITNPVDTDVSGSYLVTYTITNQHDPDDHRTLSQSVVVYSPSEPNVILNADSTLTDPVTFETGVTVTIQRPEGFLHYVSSDIALTASEIKAHPDKASLSVTDTTICLDRLIIPPAEKLYLVVELNHFSDVYDMTATYWDVVEIRTQAEFLLAVSADDSRYYLLMNSLDFSDFVWDRTIDSEFVSVFNGQGYTISNLTVDTSVRGGIFPRIQNATIKNLTLDQVHFLSSAQGSGLLVGESRGDSLIENIAITDSSNTVDLVSGTDGYGGLVVARVRTGNLTMRQISVINSSVQTVENYGGGLIAGGEIGTSILMQDIFVDGLTVSEATSGTAEGKIVGGAVGRVRDDVTIERAVFYDLVVSGKNNVGGLVGKFDEPCTLVFRDIYLEGTVTSSVESKVNSLIGEREADDTSGYLLTIEDVWQTGFVVETPGIKSVSADSEHQVEQLLTESVSWWVEHIPRILNSAIWEFCETRPCLGHDVMM